MADTAFCLNPTLVPAPDWVSFFFLRCPRSTAPSWSGVRMGNSIFYYLKKINVIYPIFKIFFLYLIYRYNAPNLGAGSIPVRASDLISLSFNILQTEQGECSKSAADFAQRLVQDSSRP
jgi:hypothetical protein